MARGNRVLVDTLCFASYLTMRNKDQGFHLKLSAPVGLVSEGGQSATEESPPSLRVEGYFLETAYGYN
ncbi:MAG: hypothetical protein RL650_621 [Pseudomonadota bacterium]